MLVIGRGSNMLVSDDGFDGLVVSIAGLFVGEGWHLTLGLLFMVVVIFLPGGLMEGFRRIGRAITNRTSARNAEKLQPAE